MIREALEQYAAAWAALAPGQPTAEALVLRHGREFAGRPLPARYAQGTPKHCFYNAQTLAARSRGRLRYVEGFGITSIGLPLPHAWCIDPDERLVDPTWQTPESCYYYGVVIPMIDVRRLRSKYDLSVAARYLLEKENAQ